jgi:uncharacterized repeat protein (TIGR01451 family)
MVQGKLVGVICALACAVALGDAVDARSGRGHVDAAAAGSMSVETSRAGNSAGLRASFAQLPLSFEPNQGQTDQQVKYLSRGSGYTLFLTSEEAVLAVPGSALRIGFLRTNPAPEITAVDRLPGASNYFVGRDPAKWRRDIPHYARVVYRDVFPGVDMAFYGTERQLEFDVVVRPGGDPAAIRLGFSGGRTLDIGPAGDLISNVGNAEIRFHKPLVYQRTDETEAGSQVGKQLKDGRYVLIGEHEIGFAVADYDRRKTLVIDPVLSYSTLLGGSGFDSGAGIAVDAAGSAYVTGETASANFPTMGGVQGSNNGLSDVFVTKLDPTGTSLVYSTYLGGALAERGTSIAVDSAGNAAVTGRTNSQDFPLSNAWQSQLFGDFDAFVTELNAQGNALLFSTYLGGSGNDEGSAIAVDSPGALYVTGGAGVGSADDFPTTQGAFQRLYGGGMNDAFVTKFDPTQAGSATLVYSTFLGGAGVERGNSIAVDSAGNAYVTGRTSSTDFPTRNPLQPAYGGGPFDAFVTELNAAATDVVYSTFLGTTGLDQGYGIAVDAAGNAYVAGMTNSNAFPTVNASQPASGGGTDAFALKISAAGSSLVYSTYLGGSGSDLASGIAVDSAGILYVTGRTSTTAGFPTTADAIQAAFGGGPNDAFIAKIDPAQSGPASLIHSSYLGGTGDEDIPDGGSGGNPNGAIAVDAAGNAYVTGNTSSADFPVINAYQATYGGMTDAFVARVSFGSSGPDYSVSAAPASQTTTPGGTATYTVTVSPAGGFTGNVDLSISGVPADGQSVFAPPTVVITDSTAQNSMLSVTTSGSTPPGTIPLTITASAGSVQHTAQAALVVSAGSSADLSVTKTGSPNPVQVLANLTYTITITNQGPSPATGVQLTDVLPNVTVVSATLTQGSCDGTSTVTCSIGALDVGSSATVTIVVQPQAIGDISNTATVMGDQPDPNPDNNSATAVTSVVAAGGPVNVLQHHLHATRDGLYIDPAITQAAAATTHRDLSFGGSLPGHQIYAQPLYVNNGPGGTAAFIVVTEQNDVVALSAADGSQLWLTNLGAPVPRLSLPCGDIDPLGITGTPVVDPDARVIFLDAMTTPDGGTTKQHLIYALSLDDASVRPGWPVDVNSLSFGGLAFDSTAQNQRGALLLNAGVLYVPYGGHFGDCSDGATDYHGWVVAVAENDPTSAIAWATDGAKGGIWAVGGLASDGNSLFAATGNTSGATDWAGGDAILRLGLDGTFSHGTADFFTPSNWLTLDGSDLDLGGDAPVILDVPGATPSQLVVALGKSGVAHLLDRSNLGGIGTGDGENGEGLFSVRVATEPGTPPRGRIRTAAASYTTASGTYVVFSVSTPGATGFGCPGTVGDLVALRIGASSPPTISVAWCAANNGRGAPIVTTTDGSSEPVVWTIGAEGTNRLYAYNGETGDPLFNGGGSDELMTLVRRFSTPIAVDGRIIVAADGGLFVFTTR